MKEQRLFRSLLVAAGAALGLGLGVVHADDTDIYLNPSLPPASEPLVMFTLDYRPNLTSTICTDVNSGGCTEAQYFRDEGLGADLPASGKLVFFDVLRLALKLVLSQVSGVKIGIMINHDNINNCEGPGNEVSGCSNGGYVLRGFESIDALGSGGSLDEFLAKLNALPLPENTGGGGSGGGGGCPGDSDCDGVGNGADNCKNDANPGQEDADGDGIGDVCDPFTDSDGDNTDDSADNCPSISNPTQSDADGDGIGDVCDADRDGDGVDNASDNCPDDANAGQADTDGDGIGDVCDALTDSDGDGVADSSDNCPAVANPGQNDADGDGVGDLCDDSDGDGVLDINDNCPNVSNPSQTDTDGNGVGDACQAPGDQDGDGINDAADNCPTVYNPSQTDTDGLGAGDACDSNDDQDAFLDVDDNCPLVPNDDQADTDGDGIGDACDSLTDSDGDGIADSTDNCPAVSNPGQADSDGNGVGDACDTCAVSGGSFNGHIYQGKELFFEFFRYLTGQGVYNGHNGFTDIDNRGGDDKNLNDPCEWPDVAWDTDVETCAAGTPAANCDYISPIGGNCTSIYTINILFQVSSQEDNSDNAITASKANGGMDGINLTGNNNNFPTVIEYLHDVDLADGTFGTVPDLADQQNVTSYFIVDPTKINTKTRAYATAGGTGEPLSLSENPEELVETLRSIFDQILSVSTTFVSASVPVNVFNRAEIVDNVYIALFQAFKEPSWPGNVKKLKIQGLGSTSTSLVDANNASAVSPTDGRINLDAVTFWTQTGNDSGGDPLLPEGYNYYEDVPPGTAPATLDDTLTLDTDGREVNRGAAGQNIPGYIFGGTLGDTNAAGDRQVFYDDSGTSLAALDADATTATALIGALGAADATEAEELIRFMRGQDVDDKDADGHTDDPRQWLFGDVLHSRPLPVNYGALSGYNATTNPGIFLITAGNDGAIRMIRNTTTGAAESGEEVWAFFPQSTMAIQPALRSNAPLTGARKHPYGIDGAPAVHTVDSNANGTIDAGETALVYLGQRRGGTNYYALNIVDPTVPDLEFRIEKAGDFAEMGQTFSTPKIGTVNIGGGDLKVLVFGGGYDENKDLRTGVGTDDSQGNAIYIVNALTGALIWKATGGATTGVVGTDFTHAELVDSIPSDVAIADTDGDGLTDRIIVGDTGGNVWRADIVGTDRTNWKLTLLAELGRHASSASGKTDDRRFFHAATIVQDKDSGGLFDSVVITSGDRADPLDKGGDVLNRVYMIKDRNTGVGGGTDLRLEPADLGDVTSNCLQRATCVTPPNLDNGWRLDLDDLPNSEKGLSSPISIAGIVFFTTYTPPGAATGAGSCGPAEGSGRLFAINLANATAAFNFNTADDISGDDSGEANSKDDRTDDLASGGIPADVVFLPPGQILRPDLQIFNAGAQNVIPSFWQILESL